MPIKPDSWRVIQDAARTARMAPYGTRNCEQCGNSFYPYRKSSNFCGRNCRRKADTAKNRAERPCKECGKDFSPSASAKAEFCGASCKRKHQRNAISENPVRKLNAAQQARNYSKSSRYRFNQANAKALRRSAERAGGVTFDEWQAILDKYDGKCAYCRSSSKLTMDHVLAISLGGPHVASNIVPSCQPCNSSKGVSDWSHKLCQ